MGTSMPIRIITGETKTKTAPQGLRGCRFFFSVIFEVELDSYSKTKPSWLDDDSRTTNVALNLFDERMDTVDCVYIFMYFLSSPNTSW